MSRRVEGTVVQAGVGAGGGWWGGHVQRNCGRRSQVVIKGPKQSWGQSLGLEGESWVAGPERSAGPIPRKASSATAFTSVHTFPIGAKGIRASSTLWEGVNPCSTKECAVSISCNYHPHHLTRMSL